MNPKHHTILIVDDEVQILTALRRTLEPEGYRIITTSEPSKVLDLLQRERVDLLISDIEMGPVSGIDLVASARAWYPDVVRILLTGNANLETALEAINSGEVYRYLTKPWDVSVICEIVRSALERLDEHRRGATADRVASRRRQLLDDLEQEHPGITRVERNGAAYILDEWRIETILQSLKSDDRFAMTALLPADTTP
ncbi:MAG: response regulator [Deltaproteobacteria bacterium]|nr:response regulator [Deltaproteobacteria bacterium]